MIPTHFKIYHKSTAAWLENVINAQVWMPRQFLSIGSGLLRNSWSISCHNVYFRITRNISFFLGSDVIYVRP